jgi:hypothetical protein
MFKKCVMIELGISTSVWVVYSSMGDDANRYFSELSWATEDDKASDILSYQ